MSIFSLLTDVAELCRNGQSFAEAVDKFLRHICHYTNWPIGSAYTLDKNDTLVPMDIFCDPQDEKFGPFIEATRASRFQRGLGLPGRVLASDDPKWIEDVANDLNFPRSEAAQKAGVRAGMAFPVRTGKGTVAVVEFFSTEPGPPSEEIQQIMVYLGAQLGTVYERCEQQQKIARLKENFRENVSTIVEQAVGFSEHMIARMENLTKRSENAVSNTANMVEVLRQTTQNTAEIASASEQLKQSIGEIGTSMAAALDSTQKAEEKVDAGRQMAEGLQHQADMIGEITTTINNIAHQCRLLSLNATIEAARAGEAGKGFAVVANEVKTLATDTANATGKIDKTIQEVRGDTNNLAGIIQGIVQATTDIAGRATAIHGAMAQQQSAVAEISQNVQFVALNADDAVENAEQLGEIIRYTDETVTETRQSVDHLVNLIGELDGKVAQFLDGMDTAP